MICELEHQKAYQCADTGDRARTEAARSLFSWHIQSGHFGLYAIICNSRELGDGLVVQSITQHRRIRYALTCDSLQTVRAQWHPCPRSLKDTWSRIRKKNTLFYQPENGIYLEWDLVYKQAKHILITMAKHIQPWLNTHNHV